MEEAGKEQEQLRPGQALPHADAAACRGNRGIGWGLQACSSQGCAREPGQFPGVEGEEKLWEGKGRLERGRSESKVCSNWDMASSGGREAVGSRRLSRLDSELPSSLGLRGPVLSPPVRAVGTCRERQESGPLHKAPLSIQEMARVELARCLPLCLVQEH